MTIKVYIFEKYLSRAVQKYILLHVCDIYEVFNERVEVGCKKLQIQSFNHKILEKVRSLLNIVILVWAKMCRYQHIISTEIPMTNV